jgi:hypothetical protein
VEPQGTPNPWVEALKAFHAKMNLRTLAQGLLPQAPPPARPSVNQDETRQLQRVER